MHNSQGLLVSLPGSELKDLKLKSSFISRDTLLGQPDSISPELTRSVLIVDELTKSLEIPHLYVSRAEMFTHGESLRWLRSEIGAIEDHLCLSDGSSVRVIPGMRNHVYFYRQSDADDVSALLKLERRAPELMFTLTSQVNTAYRFRWGSRLHTPDPIIVPGVFEDHSSDVTFHAFHMPGHDLIPYIERLMRHELVVPPNWPGRRLTYVPLTAAGLVDSNFLTRVSQQIVETLFDPRRALVLGLPALRGANAALAFRALAAIQALAASGITIPQAPSARIVFATDVPSPEVLLGAGAVSLDMFAPDTFDLTRLPAGFYGALSELYVAPRRMRHSPALLKPTLEAICGRTPKLCWPKRSGMAND